MARANRIPPVVLAILKAPRPGYVKTRLGRQVGFERATRIYRAMVERQLRSVPENFRTEAHYTPRGAAAEMRAWLGNNHRFYLQSEGDLGQRLASAFARAFRRGGKEVIAIGGDCPDLDGDCLTDAVHRLKRSEVVIGPAADGGYYLIGLRHPAPQLFDGIAWSSSKVLQQTLERVAARGLTCDLMPIKEDIDDGESLRRHLDGDAASALRHAWPNLTHAS